MAQDTEWPPVSHDTCDQVAGPFYHGTRADLVVGELLSAGFRSNYRDSVVMNHVYFTTIAKGAGLAAEMARGEGRPRVYVVEPTGPFEDDPNVTNKKFPGNPTRSYRSAEPLRIVGEITEWEAYDADFVRQLREFVALGSGEIINSRSSLDSSQFDALSPTQIKFSRDDLFDCNNDYAIQLSEIP